MWSKLLKLLGETPKYVGAELWGSQSGRAAVMRGDLHPAATPHTAASLQPLVWLHLCDREAKNTCQDGDTDWRYTPSLASCTPVGKRMRLKHHTWFELLEDLGRDESIPDHTKCTPYNFCGLILFKSGLSCLPVQETWAWSLDGEDSLEEEMAVHSSILAWKIPWTEESGRLQSMGSQRVTHDWETKQQWPVPLWIGEALLFF